DFGRIDKNSAPGRVVVSDMQALEHFWGTNYGDPESPHPGGANVLFVDNAVRWAPKVEPQQWWNSATDWWWLSNRMGYVPNPRTDEDAHYEEESPVVKQQLELDMDDIYCTEEGWGPTGVGGMAGGILPSLAGLDPGAIWAPADATHTSHRWYGHYWYTHGALPSGVVEPSEPDYGGANRQHQFYEQRGIFANEPRWDKFDSRCLVSGPWSVTGMPNEP
ncbi:MAG: hypothetical protein R6V05_11190, partial [Candidatus Brocadiia bacterium]